MLMTSVNISINSLSLISSGTSTFSSQSSLKQSPEISSLSRSLMSYRTTSLIVLLPAKVASSRTGSSARSKSYTRVTFSLHRLCVNLDKLTLRVNLAGSSLNSLDPMCSISVVTFVRASVSTIMNGLMLFSLFSSKC